MSYWTEITSYLELPHKPGVYVYYFEDGRVYIGSTGRSVHMRYKEHIGRLLRTETPIRIKWKRSRSGFDWLMDEARLLERLIDKLKLVDRSGTPVRVSSLPRKPNGYDALNLPAVSRRLDSLKKDKWTPQQREFLERLRGRVANVVNQELQ